jgi:hypothetical protein
MKLSQRVAVVGVPLALVAAALLVPGLTAHAGTNFDTVVITVQPRTTAVNTVMTPPVVVQVDRSPGVVDPSYHGTVTLSYAANPVNAPLPSGNTVTAVKGVATFSGLTFSAVGFGFKLQATSNVGTTSPASAPFDIVGQLVNCQSGQSCQTKTVSSAGTSAFASAGAASTSDELAATGGGFPLLSCTSSGGVVSFSDQNRSLVITLTLDKSLVLQANPNGASDFNICWGSATPFATLNGVPLTQANNEFEGLLPDCVTNGPVPCVAHRNKDNAGDELITVDAPGGDPHMTY